jgi:hypothetical protein
MNATTKAITQKAGTSPPNGVRMAFLIDQAKKMIDAARVPERLQQIFPSGELEKTAKRVGLPDSSAIDLLYYTVPQYF